MTMTEEWLGIWADTVAQVERRSGVAADQWRIGGMKTKARPDGEDLAFWQAEGLRQAEAYEQWLRETGWRIATMPDGKPGIEWAAEVKFGPTMVKLVADVILQTNDSKNPEPQDLVVVDHKTGARTPFGVVQLGLYASAMERIYGMRPKWGGYYMTRKAAMDDLIDLTPWGMDFYDHQFTAMDTQMSAGFYPPNVSHHCGTCSFLEYCAAVNGRKSSQFPIIKKEGK